MKPTFNELLVEIRFFAKRRIGPYSEPGIAAFFGTADLRILHLSFIKE